MTDKGTLLVDGIATVFLISLVAGLAIAVSGKFNIAATVVVLINGFGGIYSNFVAASAIDRWIKDRNPNIWKEMQASWIYRNSPIISIPLFRAIFGMSEAGSTLALPNRIKRLFLVGQSSTAAAIAFFIVVSAISPESFT